MAEAVALIASNPLVLSLVTGIASNAAYDAIKEVVKHLYGHFKSRPEIFKSEDVKTMETQFTGFFEKYDKGLWATVQGNFLEKFQQFLFPNRKIVLEQLDESQC